MHAKVEENPYVGRVGRFGTLSPPPHSPSPQIWLFFCRYWPFSLCKIYRILWCICLNRITVLQWVSRVYVIYHNSCVAALKDLPEHRNSIVIFTFAGPLGLKGSTLLFAWQHSCAQPGARWREECRICHELSWTDSIKPSLVNLTHNALDLRVREWRPPCDTHAAHAIIDWQVN